MVLPAEAGQETAVVRGSIGYGSAFFFTSWEIAVSCEVKNLR